MRVTIVLIERAVKLALAALGRNVDLRGAVTG